jgi:predicted dehydrogenase
LVSEVRGRKNVFQVGAQWVTDPIWLRAAELVKKGAIGKPTHAQCGYFRMGDGGERGMPVEDPNATPGPNLNWDAFQADAPQRPFSVSRFFQWRMYMDYSGGPSTDLYPHPMTRLFKVLGVGLPSKVVAVGGKYVYDGERDVPDTFDLLIEYPDKLTVAVLGTITNATGIDTIVRGTEGTLSFDDGGLAIEPAAGGKGRLRMTLVTQERDHMRNFLDCMRERKTPNCDIELAYRVQMPLIMAMMSFTEGKVARFDPATETIRMA